MNKKETIIAFIKKEIVFSIACILAFISMFFVAPSKNYIDYIDLRTLSLLLSLMLVVQGLKACGLFDRIAQIVTKKASNRRSLALLLVLVCFFSSMLITNDVALITFVPFSLLILEIVEDEKYTIYLIVLETLAANLGSMFTPIGNPQNLFLFNLSNMEIGSFFMLMLPYSLASFILLVISVLIIKPRPLLDKKDMLTSADGHMTNNQITSQKLFGVPLIAYIFLFSTCILTVLQVLDYRIMLIIVCVVIFLINKSLFAKADYILLLTFIAFFIFIGNMKQIPFIHDGLAKLVTNHESTIGILASQVVSNVPAAMLLSGFTNNYSDLIIGVNLGGLGTLIASMASLISYKFYANKKDSHVGRYMAVFTGLNILYLVILWVLLVDMAS